MLGIRYLKTAATVYVQHYTGGALKRQGNGLSFWYFAPTSVIAQVPVSSIDVPFAFPEVSSDFQEVTVQGNVTYRVAAPGKLAELLDYTVDIKGRYVSDDPSKVSERLVQAAQTGARQFIQSRPLRDVLISSSTLVEAMTTALGKATNVTQLGIEILDVAISSIKADPEMSKALQAESREELLKEADEAIYARRNTAVELERTIRENELQTEKVVAERTREVRLTETAAEIAVEQQRTQLVETRAENERKEAESRGAALQSILEPVKRVDWKTLLAMQGDVDSGTLISSAFEQLAQGAERIGNLNISPELLERLLRRDEE